jgi:protein TonB
VASLCLHLLVLFVVDLPVCPDGAPLALSVRLLDAMPSRPEPIVSPPAASLPSAMPRKVTALRPDVRAAPNVQPAESPISPKGEQGIVQLMQDYSHTPPNPPSPFLEARFVAGYLNNLEPAYPAISRRLGEQGRVVLSVSVSDRGDVLAVEVNQSSGHARLDDAAIDAVKRWRFVPARRGGEAVESTVLVPLRFRLGK